MKVALSLIRPSPHPVRTTWDEGKLEELAQSIREQGVIVPIKLRPVIDGGDRFEVVYGHRRLEAARRAGLDAIEAVVEGVADDDTMIQALTENIVREDMTDVEVAKALTEYKIRTHWSDERIAKKFGWEDGGSVSERLAMLRGLVGQAVEKVGPGRLSYTTVRDIRKASASDSDAALVVTKAADEELPRRQAAQVAASVAAAPSQQAKDFLITHRYNPVVHDPEQIKARAREFGAHDTIYRPADPDRQRKDVWQETPGVAQAINRLIQAEKEWHAVLGQFGQMAEVGKLAPEGRQYIAARARRLAKTLTEWADALEKLNGD